MNRIGRIAALVLSTSVTVVIAASPAVAYNTPSYWNTSGTPLRISGYGSTAQGYGYIKIFNGSNGTRMYSYAWNKFTDADNHMSYVAGSAEYNSGKCASETVTIGYKGVEVSASGVCSQQFYDNGGFRQNGLNYTKLSWTAMESKNVAVKGGADRGRAAMRMGIDIPWRNDPLSGTSYSASDSW